MARSSPDGDLILLEDQDRSLWNQQIAEEKCWWNRPTLTNWVYTIQAAITAVHAEAASAVDTNWAQIVALYDVGAGGTFSGD